MNDSTVKLAGLAGLVVFAILVRLAYAWASRRDARARARSRDAEHNRMVEELAARWWFEEVLLIPDSHEPRHYTDANQFDIMIINPRLRW